jgi:hypothetical protein
MRGSSVTAARSCLQPLVSASRYLAVHALPGDPLYFVVDVSIHLRQSQASSLNPVTSGDRSWLPAPRRAPSSSTTAPFALACSVVPVPSSSPPPFPCPPMRLGLRKRNDSSLSQTATTTRTLTISK